VSIDSINTPADNELLVLIREDNRNAFEQLYNRYWSKLYLSAYKILRERHGSEDIVQEVLVKLWIRRHELAIDNLNAYLHNAVRFQVFNHIRNCKVRVSLFEEIEALPVANNAENTLLAFDFNRKLEGGVTGLPEKCREIFLLSRREQLSTKEIAGKLDLSPKTVENQLTIALRRLRVSFGKALF